MIDADIFGDVDKSKLRQNKPVSGTPPDKKGPSETSFGKLRKVKPDLGSR